MAAPLILTNQTVGAPQLTGQYGSLTTLLDWALSTQAGWTIEYTATNIRVYRPPAGNRFRLYVNHSSSSNAPADARVAEIRGCEAAAGASFAQLTNPFPNIVQRPTQPTFSANTQCCWTLSLTADSTSRPFYIYVSDRWMRIFINPNATTAQTMAQATAYEVSYFFGDVAKSFAEDNWNTIVIVDWAIPVNSTSYSIYPWMGSPTFTTGYGLFWARDITGTVLSTYGSANRDTSMAGAMPVRGGYQNKIFQVKLGVQDTGLGGTAVGSNLNQAGPTGLIARGYFPNTWTLLHTGGGAEVSADTFVNSAYNSSASFRLFKNTYSTGANTRFLVMEETDTWTTPLLY